MLVLIDEVLRHTGYDLGFALGLDLNITVFLDVQVRRFFILPGSFAFFAVKYFLNEAFLLRPDCGY